MSRRKQKHARSRIRDGPSVSFLPRESALLRHNTKNYRAQITKSNQRSTRTIVITNPSATSTSVVVICLTNTFTTERVLQCRRRRSAKGTLSCLFCSSSSPSHAQTCTDLRVRRTTFQNWCAYFCQQLSRILFVKSTSVDGFGASLPRCSPQDASGRTSAARACRRCTRRGLPCSSIPHTP